ncbi:MAG: FMN-binding glutamate synthase family protein [Gemmatimonadetes bacterium]|nr:MAG: FMN-binding glutamate synthase family protein [Gemmatimonadota bacterium]
MTFWIVLAALLVVVVVYDLTQKRHAILRNFPVIGHFRYLLEAVGPELRQYIVTSNDEERPFSRDQRRWVYASAKRQNNYFGFGSDNDMERSPGYVVVKHRTLGARAGGAPAGAGAAHAGAPDRRGGTAHPEPEPDYPMPVAKVLGGPRGRAKAFRPGSIVNVSGMSFGSLSAAAVEAMNRGARLAGCLHNTGEGGIAPYHLHGGELVWQLGTGYFGARDERGRFSMERFLEQVERHPVRAVEIKLSQGAKPGLGGVLPAAKVTREIAEIRGVPMGRDVHSPPTHAEFDSVDGMLDFVERLAEASGLPVGIKSAVGEHRFWEELALLMARGDRGVDFITIDGGEGGTGAAPLAFADHVALPFKLAFARVYRIFAEAGVHERVTFIGSGKLGFPEQALLAFALGADAINVGREAMLAVGCIQAQRCHTGHCPTGVATQNRWLMRGLDPTSKAARLANYIVTLRRELYWLSRACGVDHPALVCSDHIELLDEGLRAQSLQDVFGYRPDWGRPSDEDCRALQEPQASRRSLT